MPPVSCPACGASYVAPGDTCAARFDALLALDHSRTEPWGSRHGIAFAAYALQHPDRVGPAVALRAFDTLDRVYRLGEPMRHVIHDMRAAATGAQTTAPLRTSLPPRVAPATVTISALGEFAAATYAADLDAWCLATLESYGRYAAGADLVALVAQFVRAALPKAQWSHATHVTVGAWHVAVTGADSALDRMRAGIRRLNDAHGTPNAATSGYHETITRAFVLLLDDARRALPGSTPLPERIAAIVAGPLGQRGALGTFYRNETLASPEARLAWVPPDRAPLRAPDAGTTPVASGGSR